MPRAVVRWWTILGSILTGAATLPASPAVTQPAGQTNVAAQATNAFAFDLYQRLSGSTENAGKNLFFSPYSISVALTMAAEGARGETAEQMGRVLRFPAELHRGKDAADDVRWNMTPIRSGISQLNEPLMGYADRPEIKAVQKRIDALRKDLDVANAKVNALLENDAPITQLIEFHDKAVKIADEMNALYTRVNPYELQTANALWVEKIYPMRQSYADLINRFYGGDAFSVDFLREPEAARQQINVWVEGRTGNRIRELLPPGNLTKPASPPLAVIVTNAVYFRGEWLHPFRVDQTTNEPFARLGLAKVHVPMMQKHHAESVRYAAFNGDGSFFTTPMTIPFKTDPIHGEGLYPGKGGFAIVEIPYKGDRLCMVVIAPVDEGGLAGVEKGLTAKLFEDSMGHLVRRETHIYLPRFKVEQSMELSAMLKAMGMVRAFTDPRRTDGAQFTGIGSSDDANFLPFLSDVLHKATVETNEKGTEAAAATGIHGPVFGAGGGRHPMKPFTPTFRADRPFIIAIRDVPTGAILFLGRVTDPLR